MNRLLVPCLLGLMVGVPRGLAQEKFEMRGLVRALDATLGTITVETAKKGGPQTYSLASADLPVRDARNAPLKLEQVKPGRKVALAFSSLTDVVAIKVFPSSKVGTVLQVHAETREVELVVKKERLRFKLAQGAHYYRSERLVAPLELRPGIRITVYYLPDSNEVIEVNSRQLRAGL